MVGADLFPDMGVGMFFYSLYNMVAQKNRLCKIKTLRNEESRIYKLTPYRSNGMRNNGKKENDSHNGYGIV